VAVEAARIMHERAASLGGQIRAMRKRRRWSQQDLATRADVGRTVIGRVERAVCRAEPETLQRIALALDVPLTFGFARDAREDTVDAGHLAIQEIVLRHGRAAGLGRQFELPTRPSEPWRSVDVVLGSQSRRLAIAIECWNTIGDLGAATRSSRRKAAEVRDLAIGLWGPEGRASLVWVLRETARNRALIARYPEIFATVFTGSSRAWLAALTTGTEPPSDPGLVWCDVATGRLHAWRRSGGKSGPREG
jgi:transcriptional regulator with XRE-family HTH domain